MNAGQSRNCGTCSMCCKLLKIEELQKPEGKWCSHVALGSGCGQHDIRPNVCREYFCQWITDMAIPDQWRPDKVKFIISKSENTYLIDVDAGSPNAWKQPEYYRHIKMAAARLAEEGQTVLVRIGRRRIAVLPDRDEDLGLIGRDYKILLDRQITSQGAFYSVRLEKLEATSN